MQNRFKPLITLVLALVATGVLSTLCPARDLASIPDKREIRATSVEPPVNQLGEPDQPQAQPPQVNGPGSMSPEVPDDGGVSVMDLFRRIGMIWAYWFGRATF